MLGFPVPAFPAKLKPGCFCIKRFFCKHGDMLREEKPCVQSFNFYFLREDKL